MKESAAKLTSVHLQIGDEKIRNSYDYFKDGSIEKNSTHLLEFLMEYAKDSGRVPACN